MKKKNQCTFLPQSSYSVGCTCTAIAWRGFFKKLIPESHPKPSLAASPLLSYPGDPYLFHELTDNDQDEHMMLSCDHLAKAIVIRGAS